MEHEWLPEESLNGTLANLFLRSTIIIDVRWRITILIERNHGYEGMLGLKRFNDNHHSFVYKSSFVSSGNME